MTCDRCGQHTNLQLLSVFNKQEICHRCKLAERDHPLYERAVSAEIDAVRHGNPEFSGIGLPKELEGRLPGEAAAPTSCGRDSKSPSGGTE